MRFTKFNRYICFVFIVMQTQFIVAQCISGCNDNSYIFSEDPNTIEYDNMVSIYHSTIIKEVDGTVKVWGENSSAQGGNNHLLIPTIVASGGNTNENFDYTGNILKIAGGSSGSQQGQFAILTDEGGLYAWGITGNLLPTSFKSTNSFGKVETNQSSTNSYGLPTGVNPTDVKMMFGSYKTLAIVTCDGRAYVLSGFGKKDGTTGDSNTWQQVMKGASDPLLNVVALRGNPVGMIAQTSSGDLYTWGTNTYLGDGTATATRQYATKMTLPQIGTVDITPKMIGMTHYKQNKTYDASLEHNTYYVLSTNGELFSLGNNALYQLGDFTTVAASETWVRVKSDASTDMPALKWMSPNEHDHRGYGAVAVLTTTGKIYNWGSTDGEFSDKGRRHPVYMNQLDTNDGLIALETGGHTLMVIRQCTKRYGYIGHRTQGSMGDGTTVSDYEVEFNFTETAEVTLCGAPTAPVVADIEVCPGPDFDPTDPNPTTDLSAALTSGIPNGYHLEWWTTEDRESGTEVTDPTNVGEGTYYAFLIPMTGNCESPVASKPVVVSFPDIQLELLKSSEYVDANSNGYADIGDFIRYTFTINNSGDTIVEDLVLEDPYIGLTVALTPNTISPGQTLTDIYTYDYYLTAADIANKSVYNLASIKGETQSNCETTKTSVDPDPLGPGDDGYDPENPDDTYTPLPIKKSSLLITNPNIYNRVKGN